MRRLLDEGGFALTELVVTTAVLGVILGTSLVVFSGFNNQQRRTGSQQEAQDTARMVLDRIVIQLRSATTGDTSGSHPIGKATSYDLVYVAPGQSPNLTNNARGVQHVRYCLDATTLTNETLWLQTAPYSTGSQSTPPSTSSCPSSAWPNQRQVARHLVNQHGSPTTPLFSPRTDSSGIITDIGVRALVDVNPSADPLPTELQSSVTLRNLDRAPTASLSCQALSNGHALCDASTSIDPDGDNLTYAWEMDGSPLPQTSYRLDQSPLASGSTHSFQVTVTDPGGKTSSASRTVTMP